jgi:hypothetical protein
MRLKIILTNAIIVLLVGLLSFVIVRQRVTSAEDPGVAKAAVERSAAGAAGVLQLQLLRAELWLAEQGGSDFLRERLANIGLEDTGRRERTTAALDELKRRATEATSIFTLAPDVAALVDANGKAVGRSDNVQTYAGEDFGKSYPALMDAIKDNRAGSDVWLDTKFSHKHLVSYAPVRDKDGKALGVVVFGFSLSDQSIANIAQGATVLVVSDGGAPKVKAKANEGAAPGIATELEGSMKDVVMRAMKTGADSQSSATMSVGVSALRNVGNGSTAAIVVGRKTNELAERANDFVWPILAATGLGLMFVIIAGSLLGNYVTDPVAKMEETLLQVINGNTNQRVQIEHAELGGLAFRINQLLNTVLGVEEDNTDDEGRPSAPPAQNHFQEAMAVDDRSTDAGVAAALAAEPEGAYYARLYREYIDAKKANGEGVDGITQDIFVQRIQGMERDAAAKFGKPVRYAVQRRDKQVVLLAIPLG